MRSTPPWIPIASTAGPDGPAVIARVISMDWVSAAQSDDAKFLNNFMRRTVGNISDDDLLFVLVDPDGGIRSVWNFTVSRAGPHIYLNSVWSPLVFHPGREDGDLLRSLIYWTVTTLLNLDPFDIRQVALTAQSEMYIPRIVSPQMISALESLDKVQTPTAALEILKAAGTLSAFELIEEVNESDYQSREWTLYFGGPIVRRLVWNHDQGYDPVWSVSRPDGTELGGAPTLVGALLKSYAIAPTQEDWVQSQSADATFLSNDVLDSYLLLGVPLPYAAPKNELIAWATDIGIFG